MRVKAKNPAAESFMDAGLMQEVIDHLAAHAETGDCTFDEIRATLGKDAKQLPDGHIHQVATDQGHDVTPT